MVGGGPLVDGFSAMNGILVIPKFRIFSFFTPGPHPSGFRFYLQTGVTFIF